MALQTIAFTTIPEAERIIITQQALGWELRNWNADNLVFEDSPVPAVIEQSVDEQVRTAITDALVKKGTITRAEADQIERGERIPDGGARG